MSEMGPRMADDAKMSEKRKGGESDSNLEVVGPSKKVRLEKSKKGYKACDR